MTKCSPGKGCVVGSPANRAVPLFRHALLERSVVRRRRHAGINRFCSAPKFQLTPSFHVPDSSGHFAVNFHPQAHNGNQNCRSNHCLNAYCPLTTCQFVKCNPERHLQRTRIDRNIYRRHCRQPTESKMFTQGKRVIGGARGMYMLSQSRRTLTNEGRRGVPPDSHLRLEMV